MEHKNSRSCIVILYTTLYRDGGDKFLRSAAQLKREKENEFPNHFIICKAVESKSEFLSIFQEVAHELLEITELHFIGHSGMYGIMFGTTQWPEQLSPFEWKNVAIPFEKNAKAFFHACRTGRWFAQFFADTFQIHAYGYFWYTTISGRKDRFSWEFFERPEKPIYIVSTPGRKSHGLLGAAKKYFLRPVPFPMLEFKPQKARLDASYDGVAELYDQTFSDIQVRGAELAWLQGVLKDLGPKRVLDIGCGTGSFLRSIENLVASAHGVDISAKMVEHAAARSLKSSRLSFSKIDGPRLPFPDNSFDVVTSVLSFRYLDWDPIVQEILRVLAPGGQLLVIDMVAAPLRWKDFPFLIRDKVKQQWTEWKNPAFRGHLRKMVSDPRWKKMVEYNPMRAEHEYQWYLKSRFPSGEMETINYGFHSRVLAFQSSPVFHKTVERMSYP